MHYTHSIHIQQTNFVWMHCLRLPLQSTNYKKKKKEEEEGNLLSRQRSSFFSFNFIWRYKRASVKKKGGGRLKEECFALPSIRENEKNRCHFQLLYADNGTFREMNNVPMIRQNIKISHKNNLTLRFSCAHFHFR